jgi:hypothetical protein
LSWTAKSDLSLGLKLSLHWRCLARYRARLRPRYHTLCTYLGHLGRRETDRIVSISCRVAKGGQGKYCFMSLSLPVSLTNSANVNDPLSLQQKKIFSTFSCSVIDRIPGSRRGDILTRNKTNVNAVKNFVSDAEENKLAIYFLENFTR